MISTPAEHVLLLNVVSDVGLYEGWDCSLLGNQMKIQSELGKGDNIYDTITDKREKPSKLMRPMQLQSIKPKHHRSGASRDKNAPSTSQGQGSR